VCAQRCHIPDIPEERGEPGNNTPEESDDAQQAYHSGSWVGFLTKKGRKGGPLPGVKPENKL